MEADSADLYAKSCWLTYVDHAVEQRFQLFRNLHKPSHLLSVVHCYSLFRFLLFAVSFSQSSAVSLLLYLFHWTFFQPCWHQIAQDLSLRSLILALFTDYSALYDLLLAAVLYVDEGGKRRVWESLHRDEEEKLRIAAVFHRTEAGLALLDERGAALISNPAAERFLPLAGIQSVIQSRPSLCPVFEKGRMFLAKSSVFPANCVLLQVFDCEFASKLLQSLREANLELASELRALYSEAWSGEMKHITCLQRAHKAKVALIAAKTCIEGGVAQYRPLQAVYSLPTETITCIDLSGREDRCALITLSVHPSAPTAVRGSYEEFRLLFSVLYRLAAESVLHTGRIAVSLLPYQRNNERTAIQIEFPCEVYTANRVIAVVGQLETQTDPENYYHRAVGHILRTNNSTCTAKSTAIASGKLVSISLLYRLQTACDDLGPSRLLPSTRRKKRTELSYEWDWRPEPSPVVSPREGSCALTRKGNRRGKSISGLHDSSLLLELEARREKFAAEAMVSDLQTSALRIVDSPAR